MKSFVSALIALGVLGGCASKLDRVRKLRTPQSQFVGEKIELSKLHFVTLDAEAPMSLGDYMHEKDLSHVLLVFGAKDCGKCQEKNTDLRDNFYGQHPLFTETDGFELIGVTTEPVVQRKKVNAYVKQQNLDFVQWMDPSGLVVRQNLITAGESFGIPFTAMISSDDHATGFIQWRINNKEKVSAAQLVSRAFASIGGAHAEPVDPSDDDPRPEPPEPQAPAGPAVVEPESNRLVAGNDRFRSDEAQDCGGKTVSLGALLSGDRLTWMQVAPGACEGDCLTNHNQVSSLNGVSIEAESSSSCPIGMLRADRRYFDSFKALVDWNHGVHENPTTYLPELAPATKPIVLGFNKEGVLVHLLEGKLAPNQLRDLNQLEATPLVPVRGADWQMASKDGGFNFADFRHQAEYTVLFAFEKTCDACQKELIEWSKPGGLVDICAASGGQCQIKGLEISVPPEGVSVTDHLSSVQAEVDALGSRVELFLDPKPYGEGATEYLERIYDGYISAKFPEWEGYGAVIYNKEGLIVGSYKSEDPAVHGDHVTKKLLKLIK
jgi:peroxiredoxin